MVTTRNITVEIGVAMEEIVGAIDNFVGDNNSVGHLSVGMDKMDADCEGNVVTSS